MRSWTESGSRAVCASVAFAAAFSLCASPALAETPPAYPLAPNREMSPNAQLTKLPEGVTPPKIDGRINDAAWQHATKLGPLTQQSPHEGAEPSFPTDVWVLYDNENAYVAVRAWDPEPEKLIAKVMRRDTSQRADDRILVTLDTFHDKRNGYMFSTNPNGARWDALIENNQSVRQEWDGIWFVKSRVDAEGWTCEFKIPLQTLSFDPNTRSWGFNIARTIRRVNEESRWASWRQNKFPLDQSEAGTLTGDEPVDLGFELDVVPYGAIGGFRERQRDPVTGAVDHRYYSTLDPGLDVFYKLTPSVTGALTFNTDFSDADVDARQVNLDRFALFFPETRDFFLQDAGIFDFGGIGEQVSFNEVSDTNGMPFFTRKIGIYTGGEIVDIRAGAKVTGRVGRLNFGVLDVQMEDPDHIGHKNLSVGRAKVNIGAESTVGVIATYGDPLTPGAGATFGADFRLRSSHVRGNNILEVIGWAQHTETSAASRNFRRLGAARVNDQAFGLRMRYPNDRWFADVSWSRVGEDFDPRLGFVNRPGVDNFRWMARRRWRPVAGRVRHYDSLLRGQFVQNLDGKLETLIINPTFVEVHNALDDYIGFAAEARSEVLFRPFPIAPGIVIPGTTGGRRYDWGRGQLILGMAQSRAAALFFKYSYGGFFGGTLHGIEGNLELRLSKHFFGQLEYIENKADLPASFATLTCSGAACEGNFTQRLVRARVQYIFSPDLNWDTFIQYDNLTDSVGWNSRVRWIIQPGNEFAFVWNQAIDVAGHDFRFTNTGLTGKLSWTFRF
jgi:hypothetical protein